MARAASEGGSGSGEPAIAYFQAQAARYRAASARGLWAWQRGREAAAVAALAGQMRGRAVLDLGCGAGFYARRFADAGARPVVAVDAAPGMIDAIADPRIESVLGDVATVALGRRFGLVLLTGVLEFVADPVAVLANARRHLEPDGRIVALAPTDTLGGRLYRSFHLRNGLAISLFTPAGLAEIAGRAGLAPAGLRIVPPFGLVQALVAR